MALSKPNNQHSRLISWPLWPDIRPSTLGDLAADHRADQQTALDTARGLRRAYIEVMAEEKGFFADASVRAYTQEESGWRDLAAFRGQKAANVEAWARIGETLMLTLMGIDDDAHAELKAQEALRTTLPAAYGMLEVTVVTRAIAAAEAASAKAVAEVEAINATIPKTIFTQFSPPNGQGATKVTPVDSTTNKDGGTAGSDHNSMAPADKDSEKAKELSSGKELGDHAATDNRDKPTEGNDTKPQNADHAALEGKADKLTDAGAGTQAGVGPAAGQGLGQTASPLAAAGGGSQAGSGSGSGSGASGLSGLGRQGGGASGLGNVGSAPKAPAAGALPPSGGPVSDFAKGFTSGASAGGAPPAAAARPLLPAEGARAPMTSQMGAVSTPQAPGVQGTGLSGGSSGVSSGMPPVAPVGAMGGHAPGGVGGSGPLPPFGSDLKGGGGPSQTAAGPAGAGSGAATTPAGGSGSGSQQGGGTGAPAAMLSGATAAGAGGAGLAEKYASVDLAPAQRRVWELQHACRREGWHIDWAVGLFEDYGGIQMLFVSDEGQGFVPSTVVLPNSMLPAMTDPVLPTDFLRRWFGWGDVTRLMLEYANARVAGGKGGLLGLATGGSTTAAERVNVPVLSADIGTNPIPTTDEVPGLGNGRYHRLSSLDHELYKELRDVSDPRRAIAQLTDRCRRLVSEDMHLPTCGHDAIGKLGMGQELSDPLLEELRTAGRNQLQLASTQRPGKGDYGPPESHAAMQNLYRASWIASQILEALVRMSDSVPDLPDAAYAVVAAERVAL
ncbi:Uncharacterised protein [Mycolicibacterium vanbaalenii]|uniref:Uncharacterized protein n=1 Tax=Mycolicibacterium vanbaalenii TaxID=110539 RepID=A0A5S9R393_MYCVN|nr:hypothetical protein [Mycolicibacterium vanbaalenii]CAA0126539.1 Uncharacterised protein [Mycolicibacterium vanbaalenii]